MKGSEPFTVIRSDKDIIVVNKRSGLLVARDRYDSEATRLDLLLEKDYGKIFAVHRIDRDTSGIVIYARNEEAHRALSLQFQERRVKKTYHCLVYGRPSWNSLNVTLSLVPDADKAHRTVAYKSARVRGAKPSETDFRVLARCGSYTWVEARPKTGRTHQIRAHLASQGVYIVCDTLYCPGAKPLYLSEIKRKWNGDETEERPLLGRLALHAYTLEFTHPATGEAIKAVAPYPKDMDAARRQLAKIYGEDPLAGNDAASDAASHPGAGSSGSVS